MGKRRGRCQGCRLGLHTAGDDEPRCKCKCHRWIDPKGTVGKHISAKLRAHIHRRDRWRCRYCGWQLRVEDGGDVTLDHVVPRSRGGSNDDWNLVTSCAYCNRRKGDRLVHECGMTLLPIGADYVAPPGVSRRQHIDAATGRERLKLTRLEVLSIVRLTNRSRGMTWTACRCEVCMWWHLVPGYVRDIERLAAHEEWDLELGSRATAFLVAENRGRARARRDSIEARAWAALQKGRMREAAREPRQNLGPSGRDRGARRRERRRQQRSEVA